MEIALFSLGDFFSGGTHEVNASRCIALLGVLGNLIMTTSLIDIEVRLIGNCFSLGDFDFLVLFGTHGLMMSRPHGLSDTFGILGVLNILSL